eukprot:6713770-Heterocapsa_arctica.AAC.1
MRIASAASPAPGPFARSSGRLRPAMADPRRRPLHLVTSLPPPSASDILRLHSLASNPTYLNR